MNTRTFTFDAEDRVVSAADTGHSGTYSYDGDGRRVLRIADGVTTAYVYDALGQLAAEYSPLAAGLRTRYLVGDPLGSTRLVTDAAGTPLSTNDYLPFGEEIPASWGARATFPSWGIYGYGQNGGVQTVKEIPENKIEDLQKPPVPLR